MKGESSNAAGTSATTPNVREPRLSPFAYCPAVCPARRFGEEEDPSHTMSQR